MRIALVADTFPPLRSSGAVQLRDLSVEFARQGYDVTVMIATQQQDEPWLIEDFHGVKVLRLKTARTKDVSYIRRTLAELLMPFFMQRNLRRSPLASAQFDAIVWYSPSIFLGPMVSFLKSKNQCPSFLIIRDIFPEWASDMGLMSKGLPYVFFRAIANYQYSVADVIGVQTDGNKVYFEYWMTQGPGERRLEVLQNWLADVVSAKCSICVADTRLSGRKIFVYAGNMGIAQGMTHILELVDAMQGRDDVGFIFVGRGSDSQRMRVDAERRALNNVLFFDEIDPDEIPALYAQCHVGLVALDVRHKTHNIPGKFISYMQAGLPVMALINPGNDLVAMIEHNDVGVVSTQVEIEQLIGKADTLLGKLTPESGLQGNCRRLYEHLFSPQHAASQIVRCCNPPRK